MKPPQPQTLFNLRLPTSWNWLGVALAAQMGWGAYPALLRYLQTVSGLPGLSLLAVGNFLVLLPVAAFVLPGLDWRVFRRPFLWLFGLMVVLRGTTNLLATRYTLAIYAQLIYLLTPFLVALLSRLVLGEQLPRHLFKALAISLFGSLLIMSGDLGQTAAANSAWRDDPLGISLAVASAFFLALYMIITRRTERLQAPTEALLLIHLICLCGFSLAGSLLSGEQWANWLALPRKDWVIFLLFGLGVLLSANLGQIRSIQRLGAALVSSLMAIRLVSALIFAGLLLGERLTSLWQVAGALIVIATLTWYLRQQ